MGLILDQYGILGLREWVVVMILITIVGGGLTILFYHAWEMEEEVFYSLSCLELKYAIVNSEPDSQMLWHYNDRCL